MASPADILTAVKNIVNAINLGAQSYLDVQGAQSRTAIQVVGTNTSFLLKRGTGRLAVITVTTAGSATGTAYDTDSVDSLVRPFYIIPNTVGVTTINMPFSFGLVITPGTGQVLSVSYS
jgi:hypothetical protein